MASGSRSDGPLRSESKCLHRGLSNSCVPGCAWLMAIAVRCTQHLHVCSGLDGLRVLTLFSSPGSDREVSARVSLPAIHPCCRVLIVSRPMSYICSARRPCAAQPRCRTQFLSLAPVCLVIPSPHPARPTNHPAPAPDSHSGSRQNRPSPSPRSPRSKD